MFHVGLPTCIMAVFGLGVSLKKGGLKSEKDFNMVHSGVLFCDGPSLRDVLLFGRGGGVDTFSIFLGEIGHKSKVLRGENDFKSKLARAHSSLIGLL